MDYINFSSTIFSQAEASRRLGVTTRTLRAWKRCPPPGAADVARHLFALPVASDPASPTPGELEAARVQADLTQSAAAVLVGVTVGAWSTWARGVARMPYWRWVLFGLRVAALKAARFPVPTSGEVRRLRLAAGLTIEQAAALACMRAAIDWETCERPDMRAAMPALAWELFNRKLALLGATVEPAPASGAALVAYRVRHGLTQGRAAALVGVSRDAWAAYEAGRSRLALPLRELLALKVDCK